MKILKSEYLQNIPNDPSWGICKVLLVRREMIHLKHIKKEIFIRRNVNIHKILELLGISLFEYIQYISNRENIIFKFNRDYVLDDINSIVKLNNTFGNYLKLYKTLDKVVIYSDKYYSIFNYLNIVPTIISNVRDLAEMSQKDNISIFISEDKELLEIGWVFGVKTFEHFKDKIIHFSLKSDL
jgi:hypothetical protein